MSTLPSIAILSLFLLAVGSCQSLRKGGAQLQHAGFQPDYDFHKSIGLLMRREDNPIVAFGSASIIAETEREYVGITVRSALEACLNVRPPLAPDCWVRFPLDAEQTRYSFERVREFPGDKNVQALFPDNETGLALFTLERPQGESRLAVLDLTGNLPVGEPLNALTVGYGIKNATNSAAEEESTILRSAGVLWRVNAEGPDQELVTTFPPAMVGAPVFTFVPSGNDFRMVWKVAGVSAARRDFPLLVIPLSRLLSLRAQHGEWPLWARLSYDDKMIPNKTGPLEIVSATSKEDVDNFLAVRITFPTADWDLRRLYLNGKEARHLEAVSLTSEGGKGILDARVPPEKIAIKSFPDLTIEYRTVSDYLMFAACFRTNREMGVEAPLTCHPKVSR